MSVAQRVLAYVTSSIVADDRGADDAPPPPPPTASNVHVQALTALLDDDAFTQYAVYVMKVSMLAVLVYVWWRLSGMTLAAIRLAVNVASRMLVTAIAALVVLWFASPTYFVHAVLAAKACGYAAYDALLAALLRTATLTHPSSTQ